MRVRRFADKDAAEISALITRTLREINSKDYSPEYIENVVSSCQPEDILKRSSWTHLYVACKGDMIVGCGAIGPYWGKEDESCLFSLFVHPDHLRQGIGCAIIETLEKDEYFVRAKRVEVPASITGTPFYLKMGYRYRNGISLPDGEGLIHLEKRKDACAGGETHI